MTLQPPLNSSRSTGSSCSRHFALIRRSTEGPGASAQRQALRESRHHVAIVIERQGDWFAMAQQTSLGIVGVGKLWWAPYSSPLSPWARPPRLLRPVQIDTRRESTPQPARSAMPDSLRLNATPGHFLSLAASDTLMPASWVRLTCADFSAQEPAPAAPVPRDDFALPSQESMWLRFRRPALA